MPRLHLAAPSSCRAFVALVALFLTAPATEAGTWQLKAGDPTYTCIATGTGCFTNVRQFTFSNSSWAASSMAAQAGPGGTVTLTGTATMTYTWIPAVGTQEPPPATVLVQETTTLNAYYFPGIVPGTYTPYTVTTSWRTVPVMGSTLILTSPTMTAFFTAASVSSPASVVPFVTYSAQVYSTSPYITLTGTTPDSTGNQNILVGQHCTASLSGLPSIPGATTTYQWSVSGPTYQDWQAQTPANGNTPFNSEASYYVGGPGVLTNPTAQWQWAEVGNGSSKSETVSVSATVIPPAGQGSAFTVSATQPVSVWLPTWTCTGIGGEGQVNNSFGGGGGNFFLFAGPTPDEITHGIGRGMTWDATVSPPPHAPVLFGAGRLYMTQLINSQELSYTEQMLDSSTVHNDPLNGQTGLDTSWPYPWVNPAAQYETGDSPAIQVDYSNGSSNVVSAYDNMSFTDYLMYLPPGSGRYVPLAKFIWVINLSATIPVTGTWSDYTGTAGTVTDCDRYGTFLSGNEFPMWTQIITFSSF